MRSCLVHNPHWFLPILHIKKHFCDQKYFNIFLHLSFCLYEKLRQKCAQSSTIIIAKTDDDDWKVTGLLSFDLLRKMAHKIEIALLFLFFLANVLIYSHSMKNRSSGSPNSVKICCFVPYPKWGYKCFGIFWLGWPFPKWSDQKNRDFE